MKLRRTVSIFVATSLFIAILSGCTQQSSNSKVSDKTLHSQKFKLLDLEGKELIEPVRGERNEKSETVSKSANEFAFSLSKKLLENVEDENFVCSPLSVWLPLSALANATDENNKAELIASISKNGITEKDLNEAASRMLYSLNKKDIEKESKEYGYEFYNPLKITNAIFVDNDVTVKKDFAQKYMDYYRGYTVNVDFSDKSAIDIINKWASDNTEGLIDNIIKEFDPRTVSAIANAIYFSDRWVSEFDESKTKKDTFYTKNEPVQADFMVREGSNLLYYEDEKMQAMPLSFTTGGGLYILLPKDGDANKLLSSLNQDMFEKIQKNATSNTGKLLLPKFEINSEPFSLKDALVSLGVPLFDEKKAPLTGGLIEENIPLFVSDAIQKAYIKVDEKGTTAAAVTIMPVCGAGIPIETKPFLMNCNKPFAFVLYDKTYDAGTQVLFTGVVNKP